MNLLLRLLMVLQSVLAIGIFVLLGAVAADAFTQMHTVTDIIYAIKEVKLP